MSSALMNAKVAVIGGGWSGAAAAWHLHHARPGQGARWTWFETAPQLGGRARRLKPDSPLDNGQHIMIGAYRESLALIRSLRQAVLGEDEVRHPLFQRLPLTLLDPQGDGLVLPPGHPLLAFGRAMWSHPTWQLRDKLSLARWSVAQALRGFDCPPELSVDELCAGLTRTIRKELVEPLCVAALNTPSSQACAVTFLQVLKDGLFGGSGASDLLIPRVSLGAVLPEPLQHWCGQVQADLRLSTRVQSLSPPRQGQPWLVNGEPFDAVILACSAVEAARLCQDFAPDWARTAAQFRYEPIATAYFHAPVRKAWPAPMLALQETPECPAQFAFLLREHPLPPPWQAKGHQWFSLVASGASGWVHRGQDVLGKACIQQVQQQMRHLVATPQLQLAHLIVEKRATFRCTPMLDRPPSRIARGLWAAGDYVEGRYPATLEGAVRSGRAAASALIAELS